MRSILGCASPPKKNTGSIQVDYVHVAKELRQCCGRPFASPASFGALGIVWDMG